MTTSTSFSTKGGRRTVTIISKKGCHLCETVHELLEPLSADGSIDLNVVEIREDDDAYLLRIPVVLADGVEVFEASDMSLERAETRRRLLERLLAG